MIVVDTNIIVYLLINGERTQSAQALWRYDPQWRLPPLWQHEFINVLASYTRTGGLEPRDALKLWQDASELFNPQEAEVDMTHALQCAFQFSISAYDAQFVSLAHSLAVPLVSEDKRLGKQCSDIVVTMENYIQGTSKNVLFV